MQSIKNNKTYINKSHIIKILANQYTNLSDQILKKAVGNIFDIMTYTLREGGKIEIRGFGNFSRRFRSKTKARNPKTGETIKLPARYVVHFKSGKELNAKINPTDKRYKQ